MDCSDQKKTGVAVMRHVDIISTLPDDIICDRILSLLPTKDSVRTSALSTRWKHLYASVPVIDIESHDLTFLGGAIFKVLEIVKNKGSRLCKLRINIEHLYVIHPKIVSWIDYFTCHSIEHLDIGGFRVGSAVTPYGLFTCETLVSLSLDLDITLSVPNIVCLPKLKELSLKNFNMRNGSDDESLRRLFSSCPVLENLTVSVSMPNVRIFDVSVTSLKVLNLYLEHNRVELVINCPNLEELTYEFYGSSGYSGDVLGVLKKCDILVYLSMMEPKKVKVIELVRQVAKVQFLSLHGDSMRALLIPPGSLPTFENLTHLELESSVSKGWRLLPSILDSSPGLETLVFTNGFCDIYDCFGIPFPPPKHIPVCLFHLKVIKIDRFRGIEQEYNWVEYFLTNALILEKMEICLCRSEVSDEENDAIIVWEGEGDKEGEGDSSGSSEEEVQSQFLSYLDVMSKRLLNLQRSSQICQIILTSSN